MALDAVFLASYADNEINEVFKKYENINQSPNADYFPGAHVDNYADDYADYL